MTDIHILVILLIAIAAMAGFVALVDKVKS
jgi:hypothetical protein